MRPANIVTAVSDVLAGITISGFFFNSHFDLNNTQPVLLLCLSTIGLYGGGVVFNDVFDAELDSIERPERPIPRGIVTKKEASILGAILLLMGIISGFAWTIVSGFIATVITIAALVYDKWGKHHPVAGPLNMGLCRGLNLLLGVSILPVELTNWWYIALVPILYIASITMISHGEVHGGNKNLLYLACLFYILVIGAIFSFAVVNKGSLLITGIFLAVFAVMIFNPLLKAIRNPAGKNIGKAVKAGVIGLILMNASWASASNELYFALMIAILLPVSIVLAKIFAVT